MAQAGFFQKLTWTPSISGGILVREGGGGDKSTADAAVPEISSEIKMPSKLLNLLGILSNHPLFFNRLSYLLGRKPGGFSIRQKTGTHELTLAELLTTAS